MKKIIIGTATMFVVSLFFVSCSSESDVLSAFSKRKYLKNFKDNKEKYENRVEERDIQLASTKKINTTELIKAEEIVLTKKEINLEPVLISKREQKKTIKLAKKELNTWNKYNREVSENFLVYNNKPGEMHEAYNKVSVNSNRVNDVVLIILGIFIPPLAVYLYEDSITSNFWVDLLLTFLFWLPGIIFAFLVMYAGVSL